MYPIRPKSHPFGAKSLATSVTSISWVSFTPSRHIIQADMTSLVNNAGYVLGIEHVGQIADADIEGMFATNVFGLISITQLLIRGKSFINIQYFRDKV